MQTNKLSPVLCCQLDQRAVFGCESGFVSLLDLEKNTFFKMQQHQSECVQVQLSQNLVYSAGFDGAVLRNDLRECPQGSRLQTTASTVRKLFVDHQQPITVMRLHGQNMLVASAQKLEVYDLRTQKPFQTEETGSLITDADLMGGNILFSTLDSTVEMGERTTFLQGARFCRYLGPGNGSNKVLVGEKEVTVHRGEEVKSWKGTGTCVGLQRDGRRMVVGMQGGEVVLFE